MAKPRRVTGFPRELTAVVSFDPLGTGHLDRHRPRQDLVVALEDHPQPAAANLADDPISARVPRSPSTRAGPSPIAAIGNVTTGAGIPPGVSAHRLTSRARRFLIAVGRPRPGPFRPPAERRIVAGAVELRAAGGTIRHVSAGASPRPRPVGSRRAGRSTAPGWGTAWESMVGWTRKQEGGHRPARGPGRGGASRSATWRHKPGRSPARPPRRHPADLRRRSRSARRPARSSPGTGAGSARAPPRAPERGSRRPIRRRPDPRRPPPAAWPRSRRRRPSGVRRTD